MADKIELTDEQKANAAVLDAALKAEAEDQAAADATNAALIAAGLPPFGAEEKKK